MNSEGMKIFLTVCAPLFALTLTLALASCSDPLRQSLDYAGDNAAELQAVLDKYEAEGDGLKLAAAEFLIGNMRLHGSKTSAAVDTFAARMLAADTLTTRGLEKWWKELSASDRPAYASDARTLTAEYLEDNIEAAVRTWREAPWRGEVSEEAFLNYVLPYRIVDERLSPMGWRDTLRNRYKGVVDTITDLKRAYYAVYRAASTDARIRHMGGLPYLLSAVDISHIRRGRCLQQCVYIAMAMRAMGIPAVVDGIQRWANYGTTGHSWVALVAADGTYTVYGGDSVARRHNPINSSSFSLKYPVEAGYPVDLGFVKRVPKVWRNAYAYAEPDYSDGEAPKEVLRTFMHPHSVDVSHEYGLGGTYGCGAPLSAGCAYLCVFGTGGGWLPVAYSGVTLGRCSFDGLADSVAYIAAVYSGGSLMPQGRPFILSGGRAVEFKPDTARLRTVSLGRKYPFARSILRPWQETTGSAVVAATRPDRSDADTLLKMERTPLYRNVARNDGCKAYRCVWYASNPRKRGSITELRVYSGDSVLTGKPFAYGAENAGQCFDGETMTGLSKLEVGYEIGIDLGRPVRIDSVAYYLRNDGNYIDPGDDYELLHYADGGWRSLGRQRAAGDRLAFDGVPEGALLLLKDRTKGKEERPFTYEHGKQVWW